MAKSIEIDAKEHVDISRDMHEVFLCIDEYKATTMFSFTLYCLSDEDKLDEILAIMKDCVFIDYDLDVPKDRMAEIWCTPLGREKFNYVDNLFLTRNYCGPKDKECTKFISIHDGKFFDAYPMELRYEHGYYNGKLEKGTEVYTYEMYTILKAIYHGRTREDIRIFDDKVYIRKELQNKVLNLFLDGEAIKLIKSKDREELDTFKLTKIGEYILLNLHKFYASTGISNGVEDLQLSVELPSNTIRKPCNLNLEVPKSRMFYFYPELLKEYHNNVDQNLSNINVSDA